jgi:hypothetical protein
MAGKDLVNRGIGTHFYEYLTIFQLILLRGTHSTPDFQVLKSYPLSDYLLTSTIW